VECGKNTLESFGVFHKWTKKFAAADFVEQRFEVVLERPHDLIRFERVSGKFHLGFEIYIRHG
jgi:hypothetical protein